MNRGKGAGMNQVRATVCIRGRVQGVFFRASTQDMAAPLGLDGYVRNLRSGDVEAVFEGPREIVERAIAWCHQGPPRSRVDQVDVQWSSATGEFDGFRVAY